MNQEHMKRMQKPVKQISIYTGEVLAVYTSINHAARATKANRRWISKCCNKTAYHSAHYRWRFAKQ